MRTKITQPPANLIRKEGDKFVQLYCNAEYEKELLQVTFQWLRNGEEFQAKVMERLVGQSRMLVFDELSMSDGAQYRCRVYTKDENTNLIVSEDSADGSLTVLGERTSFCLV